MPDKFDRTALRGRLLQVRVALYGADGVDVLARALGIPRRSWLNFERGVAMPDTVLLRFLHLTGTDPNWLLTGEG